MIECMTRCVLFLAERCQIIPLGLAVSEQERPVWRAAHLSQSHSQSHTGSERREEKAVGFRDTNYLDMCPDMMWIKNDKHRTPQTSFI
ncbi:hypothetical protein RRG08_000047 [Elysia crispata]|uniref:Uncharacterized protein n=1 Tax=Elysia crispata TaxID=231223 RepID=A0AAE0Y6E4_9GAST|nr:hypothetical protein RRG08_000047 [Elysia crispata]